MGTDSEAELFKKVPDIDTFDNFRTASESHVVITMRGIGQMEGQVAGNRIALDPEADDWGARRAIVSIAPTQKDLALWDAMVPKFPAPESITIVVAGSTAGRFSAAIPGWVGGQIGSIMTTEPIELH